MPLSAKHEYQWSMFRHLFSMVLGSRFTLLCTARAIARTWPLLFPAAEADVAFSNLTEATRTERPAAGGRWHLQWHERHGNRPVAMTMLSANSQVRRTSRMATSLA